MAREAYLNANGVREADEIELFEDFVKNTGKDLKSAISSKYFQAELKELRDAKAVKEALPTGSSRSNTSAKDSVDYHMKKMEMDANYTLEDIPDTQLRRKVLNAKIAKAKGGSGGSHFTANPFG